MTYALIAWRFLKGLPWQAYAIMAVIGIVLMAYAKGYDTARDKYKAQLAAYVSDVEQAQTEARARQITVNQAAQERYDQLAERIDNEHEATRIAVADATAAFIRNNRVRPDVGSVASGTSAATSGDSAAVPEGLPANPLVAVSDLDVQRCSIATEYAVRAHEWALGLAGD